MINERSYPTNIYIALYIIGRAANARFVIVTKSTVTNEQLRMGVPHGFLPKTYGCIVLPKREQKEGKGNKNSKKIRGKNN